MSLRRGNTASLTTFVAIWFKACADVETDVRLRLAVSTLKESVLRGKGARAMCANDR
jgi:hypothetical protein